MERPRAPAPFPPAPVTTSTTQRTRRRRRRKKFILVLKVSTIYVLGGQIFLYPFNLVPENLVIYNHSYRLGAEYLGDPDLDPVWIRIHFFIVYHFILHLMQ